MADDTATSLVTDAHCHLDQYEDSPAVLLRTLAAGVTRVVAVTFCPSHYGRLLREGFSRHEGVELALGLHPMAVAGKIPFLDPIDLAQELRLFVEQAPGVRFIGEVGMDLSPDGESSREAQEQALDGLLNTAGVVDKVLSLHNRGAVPELVEKLRSAGARRPILHSYTGTVQQLDAALDAGCHFSISPPMTLSGHGRAVIRALPRERILAESDGPFMSLDGRALEPQDVGIVHRYLGEQWGLTPSESAALLEANLTALCDGLPA